MRFSPSKQSTKSSPNMKSNHVMVIGLIVVIMSLIVFTNLKPIQSGSDCSLISEGFPNDLDLSKFNDNQLAELRTKINDKLGSSSPNVLGETQLNPSEIAAFTNLQSIKARQNRTMPSCVRPGVRAKSFVFVFMGHSGSTAMITELFNHSQVQRALPEPVDHQPVPDTNAALRTARSIFEDGLKKDKTVGFKIRPAHILNNPSAWRKLFSEFGTRIIWQYRKNLFKAAVGEYTNRVLNDTSVVEGLESNITREERCAIGAGCRFRIDNFDFLHTNLRGMVRSQRYISQAVQELSSSTEKSDSPCVREIPYEDYLYNRESTMADIKSFLGLNQERTAPNRFKATGDSMCETIMNYEEVCDKFYGCVLWQHMMEDVRHGCYCKMSKGFPSTKYCDIF